MAPGPFTVFAPNDDAFVEVIKALKTTKLGLMELANLGDILKGHVVAGALTSDQLTEGQELTTLSGQKLKVSLAGGASVNGIKARCCGCAPACCCAAAAARLLLRSCCCARGCSRAPFALRRFYERAFCWVAIVPPCLPVRALPHVLTPKHASLSNRR